MHDDTVGIVLAGGRSTRLGDRAPGPAGKAAVIVGGAALKVAGAHGAALAGGAAAPAVSCVAAARSGRPGRAPPRPPA